MIGSQYLRGSIKWVPYPYPYGVPGYQKNEGTLAAGGTVDAIDISGKGTVKMLQLYIDGATLASIYSRTQILIDNVLLEDWDQEGFPDCFEQCPDGYGTWDNVMGLPMWDLTNWISAGFLQFPLCSWPFNTRFQARILNGDSKNALYYIGVCLYDDRSETYRTRAKVATATLPPPAGTETSVLYVTGAGILRHMGFYAWNTVTGGDPALGDVGFRVYIDGVLKVDAGHRGITRLLYVLGGPTGYTGTLTAYNYGIRAMLDYDMVGDNRNISGFANYELVNWPFTQSFRIAGVNQGANAIAMSCKALWHETV